MELNLDYVIPYLGITLMQALLALIILIVGFIIIKAIGPIIKKMFMRSNLSELLAQKLATMIKFILYALLLLAVAQTLGFDTGTVLLSLSAILGLVLGFGLQDTMNNVFSGIWLAMLRPFEKGDYVELMGYSGKVGTVGTLQTEMTTLDNVFITIPNSKVWGEAIKNYTKMDIRRVNVDVGIAYSSDVDKALSLALKMMKGHKNVLKDPEAAVVVTELADSSVNLQLRAWCKTPDYWPLKNDITKGIHALYGKEGVEIPFPQVDVHLDGALKK